MLPQCVSGTVPGLALGKLKAQVYRKATTLPLQGHFVSVQPSLLAAVAYQAEKERQGSLPAWPTALADLTGWK